MNKEELLRRIAADTWLSKNTIEAVIGSVVEQISAALERGDVVSLNGFGSFSARTASARTGRNPHTGEAVAIPARRVPVFKPSKNLRERVGKNG